MQDGKLRAHLKSWSPRRSIIRKQVSTTVDTAAEGVYLVVGANDLFGGNYGRTQTAGYAFVYKHNGSEYEFSQTLTPPAGSPAGILFGGDLSLKQGELLIGAEGDWRNNSDSGFLFEYALNDETQRFEYVGQLSEGAGTEDHFGQHIARTDTHLFVSAMLYGTTSDRGTVYVYNKTASGWSMGTRLTNPPGYSRFRFGTPAAKGQWLAVSDWKWPNPDNRVLFICTVKVPMNNLNLPNQSVRKTPKDLALTLSS